MANASRAALARSYSDYCTTFQSHALCENAFCQPQPAGRFQLAGPMEIAAHVGAPQRERRRDNQRVQIETLNKQL